MPLCETCDSLVFDEDKSNPFGVGLGEYTELFSRAAAGCEACEFFTTILQSSSRWKTRLEELSERVIVLCHLSLDARKPDELASIRFSSNDDMAFDMCLSEDYEGPYSETLDSVRDVPVDLRDEKCFNQIRSWISECATHDTCSKPASVILPRKIIEIPSDPTVAPRVCLSDGKQGSYVVLSYCSGDVERPKLSSSENLDSPVTLDVDSLPKTLADAIDITRRLGYQYLWTGALCDSKSDWDQEASKLVSIYGQAGLMLSATAGKDANSGIYHDRDVLYSPALGTDKNIYLRQKLLHWTLDIEQSPLAIRGWAIVEKLLASRIVHFTERQMIWECASGYQFEAARIMDEIKGSDQREDPYRGVKLVRRYMANALQTRPNEAENDEGDDATIRKQTERFEAWHHCLDQFSYGSFHVQSDKLLAIAPIASAINDGTMGQYLAGLWSNDITSGLAWARPYFLLKPAPEYRAPSWSWASVDNPTQSLFLSWPENMMQDHAKDPSWISKYGLKLISHHIVLADPSNPYGCILEGSHLIVEGSCIGFQKLTESLKDEHRLSSRPALDQSQMFDCSCCSPRPAETQEADVARFTKEVDHHICMILQGDAWRVGDRWSQDRGFCDLLILRACDGKDDSFIRVGFMRIKKDGFGDPFDPNEIFDGLDWERRQLKLF